MFTATRLWCHTHTTFLWGLSLLLHPTVSFWLDGLSSIKNFYIKMHASTQTRYNMLRYWWTLVSCLCVCECLYVSCLFRGGNKCICCASHQTNYHGFKNSEPPNTYIYTYITNISGHQNEIKTSTAANYIIHIYN